LLALTALVTVGCNHRSSAASGASSSSASAAPVPATAEAPRVEASSSVVAAAATGDAPPVKTFLGARATEACKVQSSEIATYLQRGEISLWGRGDGVGAAWLVRFAGKRDAQLAFASFDAEGRQFARTRGVGFASAGAPQVFAVGSEWTLTWFDEGGLAYARPRVEPIPAPEIGHLGAVGPELADDVAVSVSPSGALVAAAPFRPAQGQLGLFLFAPIDSGAQAAKALGVTHHAKEPHHAAVAADADGIFVIWHEPDGKLAASRFDGKGKETDSACTIAPPSDQQRDHLSLITTSAGALAMWGEGGAIKTRALDKVACPSSPIWTVAEGQWPAMTPHEGGAIVAWVGSDGHLFAAKIGQNGMPPAKGIDVTEGSSGVKDPPAVATMTGKIAFAWAEMMSPTMSSKRLVLRIIDSACVP